MTKRPSDASMAIEMLREHSLATLAQQELERRIISGEIAAGAKLNEVEVAAALGVSRGPVREAFSALSQAGLVLRSWLGILALYRLGRILKSCTTQPARQAAGGAANSSFGNRMPLRTFPS